MKCMREEYGIPYKVNWFATNAGKQRSSQLNISFERNGETIERIGRGRRARSKSQESPAGWSIPIKLPWKIPLNLKDSQPLRSSSRATAVEMNLVTNVVSLLRNSSPRFATHRGFPVFPFSSSKIRSRRFFCEERGRKIRRCGKSVPKTEAQTRYANVREEWWNGDEKGPVWSLILTPENSHKFGPVLYQRDSLVFPFVSVLREPFLADVTFNFSPFPSWLSLSLLLSSWPWKYIVWSVDDSNVVWTFGTWLEISCKSAVCLSHRLMRNAV